MSEYYVQKPSECDGDDDTIARARAPGECDFIEFITIILFVDELLQQLAIRGWQLIVNSYADRKQRRRRRPKLKSFVKTDARARAWRFGDGVSRTSAASVSFWFAVDRWWRQIGAWAVQRGGSDGWLSGRTRKWWPGWALPWGNQGNTRRTPAAATAGRSAGRLCRTLAAPRPPHVASSTATGWPDVATIPRGARVCGHRRNKCWSCARPTSGRPVGARRECELQ